LKPLLLDFPTLFQTERLQVRKPFPGDGAEVYEAIQASLEDLVPWIPINAETEKVLKKLFAKLTDSFYFVKHLIFTYTIKYLVHSSEQLH